MPQINLDQKCADAGFKMAQEASIKSGNKPKDALNLLIRSLGVLQEQGVYSFFLYLASQDKEAANAISKEARELLKGIELIREDTDDILKVVREDLANRLDDLLLASRLLEQALIYGKYHTKAMTGSSTQQQEQEGESP